MYQINNLLSYAQKCVHQRDRMYNFVRTTNGPKIDAYGLEMHILLANIEVTIKKMTNYPNKS